MLAKCRPRNEVFRFGPADIRMETAALRAGLRARSSDEWPIAKMPKPERVEIEESDGERRVVRPWFTDLWFVGRTLLRRAGIAR